MTIIVEVKNKNESENSHSLRVHRVTRLEGNQIHVEDGVVIGPGEVKEFTVYGQTRLAVEELPKEGEES